MVFSGEATLARHARKQERKKRGKQILYESSNSICVCVVIDHFMMNTVVSWYCLPHTVRETRQDQSIDRVKSVNLSSPCAQAHHPTFAPRALSVPRALQTQNSTVPQKRARSCSQDRTHPSLAPVSKADRSEPATRQNRLLPCTSPVAVDGRGRSYAEPVFSVKGHLRYQVVWGGLREEDVPDQNLF